MQVSETVFRIETNFTANELDFKLNRIREALAVYSKKAQANLYNAKPHEAKALRTDIDACAQGIDIVIEIIGK